MLCLVDEDDFLQEFHTDDEMDEEKVSRHAEAAKRRSMN